MHTYFVGLVGVAAALAAAERPAAGVGADVRSGTVGRSFVDNAYVPTALDIRPDLCRWVRHRCDKRPYWLTVSVKMRV